MFSNSIFATITSVGSGGTDDNAIIKIDPLTGLYEFPRPGDVRKYILPILIDEDENIIDVNVNNNTTESITIKDKDFWMPDELCKVCYGCENAFTMYRRRHHCRMCGQVFCNPCSSFYIDGSQINLSHGPVRSCKLCHDQLADRTDKENKLFKRKMTDSNSLDNTNVAVTSEIDVTKVQETSTQKLFHYNNLQNRASSHLEYIISNLIYNKNISERWKSIIVQLVKNVVSSVDPNVRRGDSIDIREYVKLKIIPGGNIEESCYIDGIVFRKNVSHKKMLINCIKDKPRILILSGGIEFQRTDARLSSMDQLIEQEEKYIKILVDKVLSLKPDIIFVGKSVARKAQEILVENEVLVMQNVKFSLLERIARVTNAMLLPATDHTIQQYGDDCLGSCGKFVVRHIQKDEDKDKVNDNVNRILKNVVSKGSTYAYLQGCPSELGCSIVLRGGDYELLTKIKRIIHYAIMIAYHLRLEVAYYSDRSAELPINSFITDEDNINLNKMVLSSSLDIDFGLPYEEEIRGGIPLNKKNSNNNSYLDASMEHQKILVTSLLMACEGNMQKSYDLKGIKFYTSNYDISLGQFLMESCFNINHGSSINLIDHTLSFVHKPGRLDISVHRLSDTTYTNDDNLAYIQDPMQLPIYVSSYCKQCDKIVTPDVVMSDETWKMSFGKFLEISLYNTTACGRTNGCNHCIRDSHVLFFTCEGYAARIEFFPILPYSIHIRPTMDFPEFSHIEYARKIYYELPAQYTRLKEDFIKITTNVDREIKGLSTKPEEINEIISELQFIVDDIEISFVNVFSQRLVTLDDLIKQQDKNNIKHDDDICIRYPNILKRELFLRARTWNKRLEVIQNIINDYNVSSESNVGMLPNILALQSTLLGGNNDDIDEIDVDIDDIEDVVTKKPIDEEDQEIFHSNFNHTNNSEFNNNSNNNNIVNDTETPINITPNPKASKPKPNRITKAITRLMTGKSYNNKGKLNLQLGFLSEGRLGLKPGRKGEVIGVYEEQLATIIAYTLASQEYNDQLILEEISDANDVYNSEPIKKSDVEDLSIPKIIKNSPVNSNFSNQGEEIIQNDTNIQNNNLKFLVSNETALNNEHVEKFQNINLDETVAANKHKLHLKARMTSQKKSTIRHKFVDKGFYNEEILCKFYCDVYWATQFEALRSTYFTSSDDNDNFIRSLANTTKWMAQGGKSGATFSKTMDDRFIVKVISKVELQMFLDFAPAYFDYMANALFDNLYFTVLCKILGVYTIGYDNKETEKKVTENVVVMENIFYKVRLLYLWSVDRYLWL